MRQARPREIITEKGKHQNKARERFIEDQI